MYEITNIKEFTDAQPLEPRKHIALVENLQLLGLALTIIGQIIIGGTYIGGQGVWLVANLIAVFRDFYLHRPLADKIKNGTLTAITLGLCVCWFIGIF